MPTELEPLGNGSCLLRLEAAGHDLLEAEVGVVEPPHPLVEVGHDASVVDPPDIRVFEPPGRTLQRAPLARPEVRERRVNETVGALEADRDADARRRRRRRRRLLSSQLGYEQVQLRHAAPVPRAHLVLDEPKLAGERATDRAFLVQLVGVLFVDLGWQRDRETLVRNRGRRSRHQPHLADIDPARLEPDASDAAGDHPALAHRAVDLGGAERSWVDRWYSGEQLARRLRAGRAVVEDRVLGVFALATAVRRVERTGGERKPVRQQEAVERQHARRAGVRLQDVAPQVLVPRMGAITAALSGLRRREVARKRELRRHELRDLGRLQP